MSYEEATVPCRYFRAAANNLGFTPATTLVCKGLQNVPNMMHFFAWMRICLLKLFFTERNRATNRFERG